MTTLAKIEANQLNCQSSTGPRTAEGKAMVAKNATKHGIYSSVPVIPGEDPQVWEIHRAGVVESLAPVGLLEVNLAERAALLLWRLQRLARYEAEIVASAIEDAEVPALPPPKDPIPPLFPPSQPQTREEQLHDIREELRKTRPKLALAIPARDFFAAENGENPVPFAVAATILEWALGRAETSENVRGDPHRFDSRAYLKKLGLSAVDASEVSWTTNLIRRGLVVYANCAGEPGDQFIETVRTDLEEWAEESARAVRRLEREETAVVRLLESSTTRKQTARLLPTEGREERIAKYERHLHSLLTSTLHELERLQARREGESVPPPAVADVNVMVDTGVG